MVWPQRAQRAQTENPFVLFAHSCGQVLSALFAPSRGQILLLLRSLVANCLVPPAAPPTLRTPPARARADVPFPRRAKIPTPCTSASSFAPRSSRPLSALRPPPRRNFK